MTFYIFDFRGTVAFDHEKEQKEEPRHVSWTPTPLSRLVNYPFEDIELHC